MRKAIVHLVALVCFASFALVAEAKDLKGWGVVVMHGKGGNPGNMASVASALSAAGAKVVNPSMSWASGYRTYNEALNEMAGHIASLRSQGATRIALVGHSIGANVALGYGAQRGGVAAIAAMAPGHQPDRFISKTGESLARAKQAVAAGRGNETGTYIDSNQGRDFEIRTTAAAYVSFFDPAGPALMGRNAGALKGAALLWVVGTGDAGAKAVASGGKIITVPGNHFETIAAGAKDVAAWLESL